MDEVPREAIEAGGRALYHASDDVWDHPLDPHAALAETVLLAALPHLERALREKIAEEIRTDAERAGDGMCQADALLRAVATKVTPTETDILVAEVMRERESGREACLAQEAAARMFLERAERAEKAAREWEATARALESTERRDLLLGDINPEDMVEVERPKQDPRSVGSPAPGPTALGGGWWRKPTAPPDPDSRPPGLPPRGGVSRDGSETA